MATTFDSSSYALASCASEKLEEDSEPEKWQRLFWAFTLILLPLSLIYVVFTASFLFYFNLLPVI